MTKITCRMPLRNNLGDVTVCQACADSVCWQTVNKYVRVRVMNTWTDASDFMVIRLTAKFFKQVFSLKLFLNVEIKYVVSQKEQIQIDCLLSSSMYCYMPSDLPTLDNDWRRTSFHCLTLPWSISSRCAADAALTSAEFAAAMDLAASKIISSKFRLSSAS